MKSPKTIKNLLTAVLLLLMSSAIAQKATLTGTVIDASNQQPVPFANVVIFGTTTGVSTDFDGLFSIEVDPGYVKLEVSSVGYKAKVTEDIYVTLNNKASVEIQLESSVSELTEFVVQTDVFEKEEESPVSVQSIGIEEIETNPGGNRDISKVITSLPGVGSTSSFRNDIIIRGGAPSENVFYLDDVETPVINHFQTQGSSGGPVGMINASLLSETKLYTSAFPASRYNALSSVMQLNQLDGNPDKRNFRFTLGASEVSLSSEGPIDDKTTYIFSARQSYLQFLFQALKLPFLPTFTDAQFKVTHKFNAKNQLYVTFLGAIDDFALNEGVNDGVTDIETIERNNYILGNIPVNQQWNYTFGTVYKHFGEKSFQTVVWSRNMLNNTSYKYFDNDETQPKSLDYESQESENKLRFENTRRTGTWRLNMGLNLEDIRYTNSTFNYIPTDTGAVASSYDSEFYNVKYGGWFTASKKVLEGRLTLTGSVRVDGINYNDEMANVLNQFSPRVAASYVLADKWTANFSMGRYHKLPPFTAMGYKVDGEYVNEDRLKYIISDHAVAGLEYQPDLFSKISVEGFYKHYSDYPFSLTDSITIANLGADFGVIGTDQIASIAEGRAYGIEVLMQRRANNGLYGILAYTWVRSEFQDKNANYVASSWDFKHLLTLTAGKKFKNNWEFGLKYRFAGGLPYTPYDEEESALESNWDATGMGVRDYDQLNAYRLKGFNQLDVRVDKKWYKEKYTLGLYLDIQNALNTQNEEAPSLNVRTDANGQPIQDPNNPGSYETYYINNVSGTVIPTIGIILDF